LATFPNQKFGYFSAWREGQPQLEPMKNDVYCDCGYCKICSKSFKIVGSGVSQVKSYKKSHKSDVFDQFSLQRVFVVANSCNELTMTPSRSLVLTPEN